MQFNYGFYFQAFWESSAVSCSMPRSAKRILLGTCTSDPDLVEPIPCAQWHDCTKAHGSVCLDPNMENLRQVAARSRWTNDPQELHAILLIALKLLDSQYASNPIQNRDVTVIMRATLVLLQQWSLTIQRVRLNPTQDFTNYITRKNGCIIRLLIRLIAHLVNFEQGGVSHHSKLISSYHLTAIVIRLSRTMCESFKTPSTGRNMLEFHLSSGSYKLIATSPNNTVYEDNLELSGNAIHIAGTNQSTTICYSLLSVHPFEWVQETTISEINNQKAAVSKKKQRKRKLLNKKTEEVTKKLKSASAIHFLTGHLPHESGIQHSAVNMTIGLTLSLNKGQECEQTFIYRTTGRKMWNIPKADDTSPCNIAHPVQCVYLENSGSTAANWNDHGCDTISSNQTHIECTCPKRDLYTVLSDVHETAKYNISYWVLLGMRDERHYLTLTRNIILGTNAISLICSCILVGITIMKMLRSRFRTVTVLHFILCVSYVLLHGATLCQPFVARSHIGCQTVSVCLYVAGITTTSWLACEMIVTFQILILGGARMMIKGSLIFGLFFALVMITVPSLLTANDAFGGDLLCLPSRESVLFHIFVATMAANMLIGFTVRLLVECNIDTPAFIEPLMIEQLITHVYRMTSMHLYVTTSWSMLFLSMFVQKPNLYHLGIGTVSLQGTFLLITLGVINKQLLSQCFRVLHRKRE